jgi:hypothetical protein
LEVVYAVDTIGCRRPDHLAGFGLIFGIGSNCI